MKMTITSWGGNMAFDFLDMGMSKVAKKRAAATEATQQQIQEETGMISAGLTPTDTPVDESTKCVDKHGEGWWYDPDLGMCSYKR